jgi:hypothetical protein
MGGDAPDEFPASRDNPWGLSPGGVSMLWTLLEGQHARGSALCADHTTLLRIHDVYLDVEAIHAGCQTLLRAILSKELQ